jgi:hypothetical protein
MKTWSALRKALQQYAGFSVLVIEPILVQPRKVCLFSYGSIPALISLIWLGGATLSRTPYVILPLYGNFWKNCYEAPMNCVTA